MMVKDLMDDLEKGDRSSEHLKPEPTVQEMAESVIAAMERLSGLPGVAAGGLAAGGFLGGIGSALGAQQQSLNQAYNQQTANQQAQASQNMWHRVAGLQNIQGF